MPDETRRRWLLWAWESVSERFPGLKDIPLSVGLEWPRLPQVDWNDVGFQPYYPFDPYYRHDMSIETFKSLGVGILCGSDFDWLRRLLDENEILSTPMSGIPGLRQATLSGRLIPTGDEKGREGFHTRIERMESWIREMVDCVRTRSLGKRRRRESGSRLSLHGTQLESQRLHHAYVSSRSGGMQLPAFRRSSKRTQRQFRPEDHLFVIGLDVASCSARGVPNLLHPGYQLLSIEASRRLGSPLLMVAFLDFMHSDCYVHMPVVLKTPDEPFDERFWNRLDQVGQLVGEHPSTMGFVCHPGIQFGTLCQKIRDLEVAQGAQEVLIVYASSRLLLYPHQTDEVDAQVASDLEAELEGLQKAIEPTVGVMGVLPESLLNYFDPGSDFAEMYQP